MAITEKKERKSRGDVVINKDRCKGCGFCIEFCPTHALRFSEDFNALGYHYPVRIEEVECTGCDQCGAFCPDFAIFGFRYKSHS
ncbi:MAG: indolepyruvate ferredoxin oxidoreductase subunit alpha [Candidatus Hinthialibacter sp.]